MNSNSLTSCLFLQYFCLICPPAKLFQLKNNSFWWTAIFAVHGCLWQIWIVNASLHSNPCQEHSFLFCITSFFGLALWSWLLQCFHKQYVLKIFRHLILHKHPKFFSYEVFCVRGAIRYMYFEMCILLISEALHNFFSISSLSYDLLKWKFSKFCICTNGLKFSSQGPGIQCQESSPGLRRDKLLERFTTEIYS